MLEYKGRQYNRGPNGVIEPHLYDMSSVFGIREYGPIPEWTFVDGHGPDYMVIEPRRI